MFKFKKKKVLFRLMRRIKILKRKEKNINYVLIPTVRSHDSLSFQKLFYDMNENQQVLYEEAAYLRIILWLYAHDLCGDFN